MANLGKSFQKLINETFINYKGVLIERAGESFIALRKSYNSIEEAQAAIDNSFSSFSNNLIK